LKFTNIYKKDIRDLNVTVFASDEEGNAEEIQHTYRALGLKYLDTKGSAAKITIPNENAKKIILKVDNVVFEDGTIWEKQDSIYESVGELEEVEVFAQAKLKDYDDNYISATEGITKDDSVSIGNGIEILKRISWYMDSEELLKDAKRKYAIVKQNEDRRQESENRRVNRKKDVKKRYITAGIVVVIVAVVAAVSVVAYVIPNNQYKEAKKLINDKKYEESITAFGKLNGFLKSEEYLAEAYYNLGLEQISNEDNEKAAEYFQKGYDSDENSTHGKMCGAFLDYYAGEDALQEEEYDKAMELFKSSANAASDFNLINKAGVGMAQIYYLKEDYETAWNTIKNVYAKDSSYVEEYGTYGYAYAKYLVDEGDTQTGIDIYNSISKYTKAENLNESVYKQAVKLGEQGKISEAMELLNEIKGKYKKANKLYKEMKSFSDTVKYWVGTWKHTGSVNGEKKIFKIKISQILYKGEMCLRIVDKNNDYLGFDTVISSKNKVSSILIGTYQLKFRLRAYHNQKFTYTLKGGKKMIRELKYNGEKYTTRYGKIK
jgi:tetratricopeptide (TPR) repeat protein